MMSHYRFRYFIPRDEFERAAKLARWTLVSACRLIFVCRVPPGAQTFTIRDTTIGTYAPNFKLFCTNMRPKIADDPRLVDW